jgi:membrane protein YqaA with SNARE-associated domain
MFQRLYRYTLALADSPRAPLALGLIAFAESSFFPLPPDLLLVPMALAQPRRAWVYASIATIASVLGGILGYAIGALLYNTLGQWLINVYGLASRMDTLRDSYAHWGALFILIKGLTPIPYKLVTILSGLLGYNLPLFILLSLITRGARFFIEAGLLNRFGEPIKAVLDRHFAVIIGLMIVVVLLGFWLAAHSV